MNRLQKKCVLATAGVHLLLFVILLVGPAFFEPRPKDDLQVLDVIPANLIDALRNSGVRDAQPPPPVVQPAPQPPAPQPVVTPPPTPSPEPMVKPEPVKPAPVPDKVQPHKIEPNLKPVVHNAPRNTTTPNKSSQQAKALRNAIQKLKQNFSSSTTVDMPGDSSASYANYASAVISVYKHAWVPPDGMDNDNAIVRFTVTIASDGTVISARITEPSGDAKVDEAVQRELERVTFIAPFPEGAPEKQRDYTLNFNATRRTLE